MFIPPHSPSSFTSLVARASEEAPSSDADRGFLSYHEPDIISLLILVSFFFFLSFAEWFSDKVFKAGLIGQIVVGLIYGMPVGNIMPIEWQNTFVTMGYIGLILIIFEGGLTVRLDLLKKNFFLSAIAATVGVVTPFAFSYLLLYLGFGYGAIETFIVGAALSTTSLGTTFVVIGSAARGVDFAQTKVGIVLISAAVFDDVTGLIMASVIHNLGPVATDSSVNIGWIIGRPIVASVAMGILSPVLAKYLFSPLFRWYLERYFVKFKHVSNIVLMVLVLSAYISIAAFGGASVLYGAFLAGTFLSSLPCNHPDAPFMVLSREHGETDPDKTPMFIHTFEKYFLGAQTYVLQPMFFASIGFAIPFKKLWTGSAIWKGVVTSLLMVVGKAAVGLCVPFWDLLTGQRRRGVGSLFAKTWKPATFLGMAMVARGEIGLLIIQIGLNETPFLSEDAFITAAWAIVLNTIIGPVSVGLLLRHHGRRIYNNIRWGVQESEGASLWDTDENTEDGRGSRWTSRRHSRAVSVAPSDRSRSRHGSASTSRAPSRRRGSQDRDRIEPVAQMAQTAQTAPGLAMTEKSRSSDDPRPPPPAIQLQLSEPTLPSPSQNVTEEARTAPTNGEPPSRRITISEEPRKTDE